MARKEESMQVVKLRRVGNSTTVTLPPSVIEALHLRQNDPFVDGDKRVAGMVMFTFLRLNGLEPVATETDYYHAMMAVASGQMSKDQLADWLQTVANGPSPEVE